MDGLNHNTEVVTKHFTQRFVDLRRECATPQPLTKLTLDHVKGRFDVGPLVVVLSKEAGWQVLLTLTSPTQPIPNTLK